jgi:hypothetical protein
MKTFKEASAELAEDDAIYSLLLTGDQVQAALRALAAAPAEDADAAVVHRRLSRLLEHQAPAAEAVRPNGDGDRLSLAHELPDADALLAFQCSPRRRRR